MKFSTRSIAILIALANISTAEAHGPRISVGVNLGGPGCYRPGWCGYPHSYLYYRPAPLYYMAAPRVIVQPAPVVVQQAPVVVQPDPVYVPGPATVPGPAPAPGRISQTLSPPPAIQPAVAYREPNSLDDGANIARHLELLRNPDASVRSTAVLDLGRSKSSQVVAPLAATLAGDSNPEVRDAAARALGLVGSPSALPALRYAAQSDGDRDVRRSCQFAVDVIQNNLQNK